MGLGRARNNIDGMTRLDQRLTEITHINALPASMGLTPVAEQRNAQGPAQRRRFNGGCCSICRGYICGLCTLMPDSGVLIIRC